MTEELDMDDDGNWAEVIDLFKTRRPSEASVSDEELEEAWRNTGIEPFFPGQD